MDRERGLVTVDGLKAAYSKVGMAGFSKDTHPLDLVVSVFFDLKGGGWLLLASMTIADHKPAVATAAAMAGYTLSRVLRGLWVGRFGFTHLQQNIN